jgi:hypothetical protein
MENAPFKRFPSQFVLLIILIAQPGFVVAQEGWLSGMPAERNGPTADAIVAESFPVATPATNATPLPKEALRPVSSGAFAAVVLVTPRPQQKPAAHPFWDRKNRTLFAVNGALAGADFFVTRRNLGRNGTELNPVARMFTGSTRGLAANFAMETGGVVGVSYLFHKTGHHKLERMTSYINLGASAFAVTYGLAHH